MSRVVEALLLITQLLLIILLAFLLISLAYTLCSQVHKSATLCGSQPHVGYVHDGDTLISFCAEPDGGFSARRVGEAK
jgi:hypothetical protein